MQYTIEARELTSERTQRSSGNGASQRTTVDAADADEAINRYVQQRAAELVSLSRPGQGQESIATVKKEDSVYLVRVYAA